jgi:hypothetical protein
MATRSGCRLLLSGFIADCFCVLAAIYALVFVPPSPQSLAGSVFFEYVVAQFLYTLRHRHLPLLLTHSLAHSATTKKLIQPSGPLKAFETPRRNALLLILAQTPVPLTSCKNFPQKKQTLLKQPKLHPLHNRPPLPALPRPEPSPKPPHLEPTPPQSRPLPSQSCN